MQKVMSRFNFYWSVRCFVRHSVQFPYFRRFKCVAESWSAIQIWAFCPPILIKKKYLVASGEQIEDILHARVEGGMNWKNPRWLWLVSMFSLNASKENVALKKKIIVNLAVSSLWNLWTQFTIRVTVVRSSNLIWCVGIFFIFYISQVKFWLSVLFKKIQNSQEVLISLIRLFWPF